MTIKVAYSGVVSVQNTSTVVLEANPSRTCAYLVNNSDADIYINFDRPAVTTAGVVLKASGGCLEINFTNPFYGKLYAIAAVAGKDLYFVEMADYI